ncbi:MAG: cytochrome c [Gammaproteobacteria bacterium]|nr:cytochrome c [Gammaproteobacteria bacterium]
MKSYFLAVPFLLASLTGGPAQAFDAEAGKQLVDDNCYACHGDDVYTRPNRMVTSRPGLTKQVQRCELSLGLTWFDEDVDNAAGYLNQQFYHFGK